MAKAGCHRAAAVDAGKSLVCGKSAERQRLFDDRKILVLPDMHDARIRDDFCCEDTVRVALLGGHQAGGCKENRRGQIRKFFLLILPGRAKIPLEMRVFFEFRIGVRGQHFAVGVDIDALARRLLQQEL